MKIKNLGISRPGAEYYDTLLNPIGHHISSDDIGIILARDIKHCYSILHSPSSIHENENYEYN